VVNSQKLPEVVSRVFNKKQKDLCSEKEATLTDILLPFHHSCLKGEIILAAAGSLQVSCAVAN